MSEKLLCNSFFYIIIIGIEQFFNLQNGKILQELIQYCFLQVSFMMISDYLLNFEESNENLLQFQSFDIQDCLQQPHQHSSPLQILNEKQNVRSETSNQDLNQCQNFISKQKLIKKMPKLKKNRKRSQCDYRKNICGYITQKIIKDFLDPLFNKEVYNFCETAGCTVESARSFYRNLTIKISGPTHLPKLLMPQNTSQISIKLAFKHFFKWFLKNRYLRYIILQGRMQNKEAYIQYKNEYLVHLVENNGSKYNDQEKFDLELLSF